MSDSGKNVSKSVEKGDTAAEEDANLQNAFFSSDDEDEYWAKACLGIHLPRPVLDEEDDDGHAPDSSPSSVGADERNGAAIARYNPFETDDDLCTTLLKHVKIMTSGEKKKFMMEPMLPGVWMECAIIRVPTGITRLSRKYIFQCDNGVFLAAATKRPRNKTTNYLVSSDDLDMSTSSPNYLGKIRSNFVGSEFTAFDTGLNPKRVQKTKGTVPDDAIRSQLAMISYDTGFFNNKTGLRKVSVILPHLTRGGVPTPCRALTNRVNGLRALAGQASQASVNEGQEQLVRTYVNKPATWSPKMKSYVLDFNKRVMQSSVKNFQLVASNDFSEICLQFGRVSANKFNLDFRHPLTPFQAFAIAITSLDYKLCSE